MSNEQVQIIDWSLQLSSIALKDSHSILKQFTAHAIRCALMLLFKSYSSLVKASVLSSEVY